MTDDEIKALLREFKKQEQSPFKASQVIWGIMLAIASYLATSKMESVDASIQRQDQRIYEIGQIVAKQSGNDLDGKINLILQRIDSNTQRIDALEKRQ